MLLPLDLIGALCGIALFAGFIKGGVPTLGALLSAVVALVFPARDALGITLLFLLVGDVVAVSLYWRSAHWQQLKKMALPVLLGIVAGGLMLAFLDNRNLGLALGLMILFLVALEPFRTKLTALALRYSRSATITTGLLAGIATTLGNASGPILSLYFLLLKLDKKAFIGTGSIFFLCVNVSKVPIFLTQGIFKPEYFWSIALTAPLVFVGAMAGKTFLEWIPQSWFNRIVLVCTALAGLGLVGRFFFQ